jgi:exportin-7
MLKRLLTFTLLQTSRHYELKYKGIAICTTILARCLDGGYVNFGVFSLYGDPALDVAMDVAFKLLLSIPSEEVSVGCGR